MQVRTGRWQMGTDVMWNKFNKFEGMKHENLEGVSLP